MTFGARASPWIRSMDALRLGEHQGNTLSHQTLLSAR